MHACQREFAAASTDVTDKVVQHGYHRFHPWFLREFQGKEVRLLEIGLDKLGSVRLWQRYFAEGLRLHGIDRDEKPSEGGGNTRFHKVDQGSAADLRRFAASVGTTFHVILDDGSHVPAHQMLSLTTLWPLLVPGGVYIIEDVETSYWKKSRVYGYRFDARKTSENLISQLKAAVDAVNFEFLPMRQKRRLRKHLLTAVLADIEMVSFGQNCVILLKKDATSFGQFYERKYGMAEFVMVDHWLVGTWKRIRWYGAKGFAQRALQRFLNRT